MKILFVGVFDSGGISTNNSQLKELRKLSCSVEQYSYRERATIIGKAKRDIELFNIAKTGKFELVIFSKCNGVKNQIFKEISKCATTCLWFMDPVNNYNYEMAGKAKSVDFVCCDKINVLEVISRKVDNVYHVPEGFDIESDTPVSVPKVYDVSFIGSIYGNRRKQIRKIDRNVHIISGVYGKDHAVAVSKSKINLNFCTRKSASDRVYKVLAAGGFLITDDWDGRSLHFKDGRDLVIFEGSHDLNQKINFYMENHELAVEIARNGAKTVKPFDRRNWAIRIIDIYETLQNVQ